MKFNKVKGFILVLLFVIAFVWWGSAKAAGQIEIGPSQVSTNFNTGVMVTFTERVQDKYDFTLGYITEQKVSFCDRVDCDWTINSQIFFGIEYLVTSPWTDKLRLGIGPYYFQNRDRVATTNLRLGLSIEYRFNRRWGFRARHFSNAGSGSNMEICRPKFGCITNDWNTGQDSWARVVWYF